ncbi:hypothetical protein GCM10017776_02000 [Streptomyces griseoluteus]|nr:hypothetical protein GCM10017776_02000 [Streptomyces griseoluteus]
MALPSAETSGTGVLWPALVWRGSGAPVAPGAWDAESAATAKAAAAVVAAPLRSRLPLCAAIE